MSALRWIERVLLTLGLALAGWSVLTWTEARYFASLPVPSVLELPGDPGDVGRRPAASRQVPRGTWVARLEAPSVGLAATVLEGSDEATLARAAGHIETTALPGTSGNVGIAGHRDRRSARSAV